MLFLWIKVKNWVAAGAAGVAVVDFAPAALGFGAAGILAGSPAAVIMSTTALANGGGVAAGSACAILQSAGAVGLTAKAAAIGGTIGAGAGFLLDDEEKYNQLHTLVNELGSTPAALGFEAAGILAGPPAAAIMSTTALANGGGVAAGSV
ncbi:interferon alpha-inducible protein 27-like protein 2A [Anneissia japonica]|uniref:interferon alpha-inducible protein 27-like protein 2A n=1 Tax=Anneissia japonica TaxID=1529436 RepID=UPI0014258D04|nr:interferon alpha-inducible protein 27-like protein 2A [Anneissia japonica]